MKFTHYCYTEAEAQGEAQRLRAEFPDRPLVLGRWSRAGVATTAVFVGVTVVAIGLSIGVNAFGATLAIVGGLSAIFSFLARLVIGEMDGAYERERRDVMEPFERATNPDLEWLVGEGRKHPEVAEAVRSWVREGKVLRQRDVRAVRAYIFQAEPIKAREGLLAQLG